MAQLGDILRTLGIPHERQTENAFNIQCPLCSDGGHHCGIFHSTLRFHCFKCKRTGSLFDLLKLKLGISWPEYQAIVKTRTLPQDGSATSVIHRNLEGKKRAEAKTIIPDVPPSYPIDGDMIVGYPDLKRFLDNRRIDIATCQDYDARYCPIGEYGQRIILPIWNGSGKYTTFQARDITGRAKVKYLSGHGSNIYRHLYWSDGFQTRNSPNRVWVVEGIFDVWRMRINTMASFGKQLSSHQRTIIAGDATIDELVFAWDADALKQTYRIAGELACLLPRVGVVRLPEGQDPDSLGAERTKNLPIDWM